MGIGIIWFEGNMDSISATLSQRDKQYGDFAMQSAIAAVLKRAMRAGPGWARLKPDQQEALDHIQVKISRILNGNPNYADSWHDISGYATLVEQRLSKPSVPDVD
jgi:hypothetical protein